MTTDRFAWITGLTRLNRVALLDVLEDMQDEIQVNPGNASIPLLPQIIKHAELFPGDSIAMRDRYMETRYKAALVLQKHGIVNHLDVPEQMDHRWRLKMRFSGDPAVIAAALGTARENLVSEGPSSGIFLRYGRLAIAFVLGASATVSMLRPSWWLWMLSGSLCLALVTSLGLIPRWRGTLRTVADWATVIGAGAAIALLIWTILHTQTGR